VIFSLPVSALLPHKQTEQITLGLRRRLPEPSQKEIPEVTVRIISLNRKFFDCDVLGTRDVIGEETKSATNHGEEYPSSPTINAKSVSW
jgi:hypothetical protein